MREQFGIETVPEPTFEGFDGVVLATPHDAYEDLDVEGMAAALNDDPVLLDVMGAIEEDRAVEAGFTYRTL